MLKAFLNLYAETKTVIRHLSSVIVVTFCYFKCVKNLSSL